MLLGIQICQSQSVHREDSFIIRFAVQSGPNAVHPAINLDVLGKIIREQFEKPILPSRSVIPYDARDL